MSPTGTFDGRSGVVNTAVTENIYVELLGELSLAQFVVIVVNVQLSTLIVIKLSLNIQPLIYYIIIIIIIFEPMSTWFLL